MFEGGREQVQPVLKIARLSGGAIPGGVCQHSMRVRCE